MRKTDGTTDFGKYIVDRDIDSRIRSNRDDMLQIVQTEFRAEFKRLDEKIDNRFGRLDDKVSSVLSMLRWGIGMFVTIILAVAALAVTVVFSLIS